MTGASLLLRDGLARRLGAALAGTRGRAAVVGARFVFAGVSTSEEGEGGGGFGPLGSAERREKLWSVRTGAVWGELVFDKLGGKQSLRKGGGSAMRRGIGTTGNSLSGLGNRTRNDVRVGGLTLCGER